MRAEYFVDARYAFLYKEMNGRPARVGFDDVAVANSPKSFLPPDEEMLSVRKRARSIVHA